jgi:hypothetical protein
MLMNILKDLIQKDPYIEDVDLEQRGITNLDIHSIELLARFQKLKSINLSENHIFKIP